MTFPEGLAAPSRTVKSSLEDIGSDVSNEVEAKTKAFALAAQTVSDMRAEVLKQPRSSTATEPNSELDVNQGWVMALPQSKNGEPRSVITFHLRNMMGVETKILAEPNLKVWRLKEVYCDEGESGVPPVLQRLIYGGQQFRNHKTIGEYGVEDGATIHVVLACRGS